jgi:hypothetical protein
LLCACTKFEHPLIAENGPALDESLIGQWQDTAERGRVELTITRQDGEGHVVLMVTEPGKSAETSAGRLVTARLERQTFASIRGGGPGRESWTLVRYELHPKTG